MLQIIGKKYSDKKYDIVIGPVANDNTMPVINDYMSGNISEETALAIFDMWENEIETGDPRNSLYLRGDEIE